MDLRRICDSADEQGWVKVAIKVTNSKVDEAKTVLDQLGYTAYDIEESGNDKVIKVSTQHPDETKAKLLPKLKEAGITPISTRVTDSNKRLDEYILGSLRANGIESAVNVEQHKDGFRVSLQGNMDVYLDIYLDGENVVVRGFDPDSIVNATRYATFAGVPVEQAKQVIRKFEKWANKVHNLDARPVAELESVRVTDDAPVTEQAVRIAAQGILGKNAVRVNATPLSKGTFIEAYSKDDPKAGTVLISSYAGKRTVQFIRGEGGSKETKDKLKELADEFRSSREVRDSISNADIIDPVREAIGDAEIIEHLVRYMSDLELEEFVDDLKRTYDLDFLEDSVEDLKLPKFSSNAKLNKLCTSLAESILAKYTDESTETMLSELQRYKSEFPREPGYNFVQYGNTGIISYSDAQDALRDAGYTTKMSDEAAWDSICRTMGQVIRTLLEHKEELLKQKVTDSYADAHKGNMGITPQNVVDVMRTLPRDKFLVELTTSKTYPAEVLVSERGKEGVTDPTLVITIDEGSHEIKASIVGGVDEDGALPEALNLIRDKFVGKIGEMDAWVAAKPRVYDSLSSQHSFLDGNDYIVIEDIVKRHYPNATVNAYKGNAGEVSAKVRIGGSRISDVYGDFELAFDGRIIRKHGEDKLREMGDFDAMVEDLVANNPFKQYEAEIREKMNDTSRVYDSAKIKSASLRAALKKAGKLQDSVESESAVQSAIASAKLKVSAKMRAALMRLAKRKTPIERVEFKQERIASNIHDKDAYDYADVFYYHTPANKHATVSWDGEVHNAMN